MKIIQTIQNTPEWEELRENKLGASDANIIMGMSEYCTIRQLWKQKALGEKREEGNTFAQDKGHRLELKNRAMLELEMGVDFPPMTVLSDVYPFLMASLDGIAEITEQEQSTDEPVSYYVLGEFKYCGQDDFELVKSGECLPQYKPQIQQQLLLTGAKYCILGVTTEDKEAIAAEIQKMKDAGIWNENSKDPKVYKYARATIMPDMEYMEKELLPALVKFHHAVITKTDPGYGPRDVKDESDNTALSDTLTRYKRMLKDKEEIESLITDTEKEIFKLVTHTNVVCIGVEIKQSQRSASKTTVYDFEKFLLDQKLTLPPEYISIKVSAVPKPTKTIKFPKEEPVKETKSAEEMIVNGAHIGANATFTVDGETHKLEDKPKRTRRTKAEMEAARAAKGE